MLGVDVGGTFTDVVAIRDGRVDVTKVPSDPGEPASAVIEGARRLGVEDSSVFTPDARQQAMPMAPDVPAFRSFKGTNSLLLKDGQTRQYTVATDRVTGEVLKVDVSLKVLKN